MSNLTTDAIKAAIQSFEMDTALLLGSNETGELERNQTALAALRECAERRIEPTRNETLDTFMDALVHCDTVKVILTGIGETAWDTKTIYEAIAKGCGRKLKRSDA